MVPRSGSRQWLMMTSRRQLSVSLSRVMGSRATMGHSWHMGTTGHSRARGFLARGWGLLLFLIVIGVDVHNQAKQGEEAETFFHIRVRASLTATDLGPD